MTKRRPRGTGSVYRPKTKGVEQSVWWISYRVAGQRVRESAATTVKTEAEKILRARIVQVDRRELGDPAAMRTTLDDLEAIVLQDFTNNGLRSSREVKRSYQRLRDHFGGAFLARNFDEAMLAPYKAQRLGSDAANGTVNRELAQLKRGLRLAVRQRRLAVEPKFGLLREGRPRQGFLEPEQLDAILARLPAHLRPAVTFGYWTGWRIGEVTGLEWRQVDRKAGVIRIEQTKNDEARTIPYAALPQLLRVIEEQRAHTDQVERRLGRIVASVFHRDGERLRRPRQAWIAACTAAGLPGRLVHDMRRSAARNMIRAGIQQRVAMAIGGWKTDSIFRRYAIVDEKLIAEGLAKLARL